MTILFDGCVTRSHLLAVVGSITGVQSVSLFPGVGKMVLDESLRESHRSAIYTLAFGMDDEALFSGDDSGLVVRWNTDDWAESRSYHHGAAVRTLMASRTGEWILTGGMDGVVNKLLPSAASYPKPVQRGWDYFPRRSQFTSEGAELVVVQPKKSTGRPLLYTRYRPDEDKLVAEFPCERPIALSRKHQWVAARSLHDNDVVIWDGNTGNRHRVLPLPPYDRRLRLSALAALPETGREF